MEFTGKGYIGKMTLTQEGFDRVKHLLVEMPRSALRDNLHFAFYLKGSNKPHYATAPFETVNRLAGDDGWAGGKGGAI